MNTSVFHPFGKTVRLMILVMLVFALTLGTGQLAQAAPKPKPSLAPVNLGQAANYVILAGSGITNVPVSKIIGNMGVSPIGATAITGFPLTLDSTGTFSTSPQVTGKIYAANYTSPTPINLTKAMADMLTAYTNAAGRAPTHPNNLGAGNISGLTLAPGVWKWGTGVSVNTNKNAYLVGDKNAVWIFQVSGVLNLAAGAKIILSGGASAKNIFWVVNQATLGSASWLEGTILSASAVTMASGATLRGRALAHTNVTLISNVVSMP
jgi:hypothetical protein